MIYIFVSNTLSSTHIVVTDIYPHHYLFFDVVNGEAGVNTNLQVYIAINTMSSKVYKKSYL